MHCLLLLNLHCKFTESSAAFQMFVQCELAVDAVHKRTEEEGSTSTPPRREDITDTMIFSPSDLVTMICRDVDLNYATRGKNFK